MSLLQNTMWNAVAAVALAGGRFLVTVLLARRLEVEDFGRFAFAQWLVDFVFLYLSCGLPGAASRYFAEYATQPASQHAFQRWFCGRAVAVVGLVAVTTPLAALGWRAELSGVHLGLLTAWAAVAAVWALLIARAQGLQAFQRLALSHASFVVVAVGGTLALSLVDDARLTGALAVMVASTVVATVMVWTALPRGVVDAPTVVLNHRALRRFAGNIWLAGLVSGIVWSRGELAVLQATLGPTGVAQYSAALSLAAIAISGTMLLAGGLVPHVTALWGAGAHAVALHLSRRVTDAMLLVSGLLAALLIASAPELVHAVYGPAYAAAGASLQILALGTLGLASSVANLLAQLTTEARFNRNINGAGAVLLLLLAVFLSQGQGLHGTAGARVLALLTVGGGTLWYASHAIGREAVDWTNVWVTTALTLSHWAFVAGTQPGLALRVISVGMVGVLGAILIRDASTQQPVAAQLIRRVLQSGAHWRSRSTRVALAVTPQRFP